MFAENDEAKHLNETLGMIEGALARASGLLEGIDGAYHETKHYLAQNRGEIDPQEMQQSHLALQEIDRQAGIAYSSKAQLEKLRESPYFARVDFASSEGDEVTSYIGRFAFSSDNAVVISDWRSPVAGLFYDFELGEASYVAPAGLVCGTIVGKRQFRIEEGQLVYALDSASSVRDEVLQRELSKTSDQKMRSIIASIQKEQNAIIRDERPGTLVIQGVAGSGKTSIALHRIAYLLYRQKERLSSSSVVILSPNKVFSDYISNVLPELGEEPLGEQGLYDMAVELLHDVATVQPPRSFIDDPDESWRRRARLKSTVEFVQLIDSYLGRVVEDLFEGADMMLGRVPVEGAWLEARYRSYGSLAIDERLDLLASDVVSEVTAESFGRNRFDAPSKRDVRKKLVGMLKAKDPLALYGHFLIEEGIQDWFVSLPKRTVEWEDAYPLVLFRAAFAGFEEFSGVQHLVVDEMQDLTPVQHRVIARLFSCDKTILGDCFQMVDDREGLSLDEVASFYANARTAQLLRSYRSTAEIVELARRVKPIPGLEAVARHGAEPQLFACSNTAEVLEKIAEEIRLFEASEHKTLGILHKSDVLAHRYAELLGRDFAVHVIGEESVTFSDGVTVSSVKMAKGLEFDEVIVLDVDAAQYASAADRNLLYVAITRAMHKLTLLYRGSVSDFLAE